MKIVVPGVLLFLRLANAIPYGGPYAHLKTVIIGNVLSSDSFCDTAYESYFEALTDERLNEPERIESDLAHIENGDYRLAHTFCNDYRSTIPRAEVSFDGPFHFRCPFPLRATEYSTEYIEKSETAEPETVTLEKVACMPPDKDDKKDASDIHPGLTGCINRIAHDTGTGDSQMTAWIEAASSTGFQGRRIPAHQAALSIVDVSNRAIGGTDPVAGYLAVKDVVPGNIYRACGNVAKGQQPMNLFFTQLKA